ncbi:electron transfer flavoprotein subunit beta/FixA family protein [Corynebacterium sp. ES2794-CONJ1]|uniref:electron transfer flavoprotein subunit beta/FixA family protein n=1 Tax=unclassified Corynebacterium TaxID=2624378 RepID=UPI002169CE01|nr:MULTISPECIES: electron transfer flavoprotein subunit beta/FixA family protein [unclassified Corynebacterium]MCS4489806.1 electron transfer flavoprotein subunit beta/FixA family protein [Corynebacterium sp. ES2775-CONJ]MCS4491830.1 electron transfer flavoprotein subunit beta/FixA family protein [Corynebacterium sp. ES2715-CONJ3]MCS4531935.1 electron transfer flavoprotein subunit beta/FixA family protein [Corynebacterium sp. ES2730-CONJ]MCU9519336.1 electron transfer flavoprotein subunit beta/
MPAIVVLVKNVPDTWSAKSLKQDYTLDRESVDNVLDEVNEYAVEQALQLRDSLDNSEVVALSVAPNNGQEALRKALAMGADRAIQVADEALAGSDIMGTAWVITNALNLVDDIALIIAGQASSDGAMGALPGILAEYRSCPALTSCTEVKLSGATVTATRQTHSGIWEVEAQIPAVISVTDQADKPRFPNFKGIMAAKKAEIPVYSLEDIGVAAEQVGLAHAATRITHAVSRGVRGRGETIYGDADTQAEAVVEFLAARNLLTRN